MRPVGEQTLQSEGLDSDVCCSTCWVRGLHKFLGSSVFSSVNRATGG